GSRAPRAPGGARVAPPPPAARPCGWLGRRGGGGPAAQGGGAAGPVFGVALAWRVGLRLTRYTLPKSALKGRLASRNTSLGTWVRVSGVTASARRNAAPFTRAGVARRRVR